MTLAFQFKIHALNVREARSLSSDLVQEQVSALCLQASCLAAAHERANH